MPRHNTTFPGFKPEALDFLALVRINDSKAWYDEHKPEYRRLLVDPFCALVTDLAPVITAIDPAFVTAPAVGKTISRLRRHTRFTKEKNLYRDAMWLSFHRRGEGDAPGFYFEITPAFYRYGMGFWAAQSRSMEAFRAAVLGQPERFRAAISFFGGDFGFELMRDGYKRDRHPDAPEDLKPWLNCKSFYLSKHRTDMERIEKPDLLDEIARGFAMLGDLYRFIMDSLDAVYKAPPVR